MDKQKTMEECIQQIAEEDVEGLIEAQVEYGDSWKQRGGPGAWFTVVRPLDRLNTMMAKQMPSNGISNDIFQLMKDSESDGGVLNAVRDLRRYLMLVEAEVIRQGADLPLQRHNAQAQARKLRSTK